MDLRRYVRAIRRSWWIVLIIVVLGFTGGYLRASRSPKIYAATVTFVVSTPEVNSSTAYGSDQFAQDRANSYALLLSSQEFASTVRSATGVDLSTADIAAKISGSAQVDTTIVTARVQDTSLRRLVVLQRGVRDTFPSFIVDRIETSGTIKLTAVSAMTPSSAPVSPRTTISVLLGVVAGLVIGLLLAALREAVDTSVRSGTELEEIAGVPLIGSIVHEPAARRTPVVSFDSDSRRAEDFRQLRTNLDFVNTAGRVQAVVVTSSIASEGKSTTAANIAATAAESGMRVVLVDADLRRPQIGELLGYDHAVGLTTVLSGRIELSTALRTWGEHGLAVLPSGAAPPNPSELLSSDSMRSLVRELRSEYDLIVIDTPPVLTVTDAAVCSALVDGIVLLYRYGRTRRANLVGALHALRAVDARLLGVVLNMRPRRGVDGEQYGSYESYVPSQARPRLLTRLTRRLRRSRRVEPRRLTPSTTGAGQVPRPVVAEAAQPTGYRPATTSHTGVTGDPDPSTVARSFAARRARRPLLTGRLSVAHLATEPDPVAAGPAAQRRPARVTSHRAVDVEAEDGRSTRAETTAPDDSEYRGLLDGDAELDHQLAPILPGSGVG